MASPKLKKLHSKLNENFREELAKACLTELKIEVESYFNIFSMQLNTVKKDETDFTLDQLKFIDGYSKGFAAAMSIVYSESNR